MERFSLYAVSAFGLEALVKEELEALGIEVLKVADGRIEFEGDIRTVALANINLRCADRVYIKLAEFPCSTFDELYDNAAPVEWARFLPVDAAILTNIKSVKSTLNAHGAIGSVLKKAVFRSMERRYKRSVFPESGRPFRIEISIRGDIALLALDTSGEALSKRGWRDINPEAALRETLAAAMLKLAWFKSGRLVDPFCGSGTIPIEAAHVAKNIAPGIAREFAGEYFEGFRAEFDGAREQAQGKIIEKPDCEIFGFDIDEKALSSCRRHAINAGVAGLIHFQRQDVRDFNIKRPFGTIVTNPPYGIRLCDDAETYELMRAFGAVFSSLDRWKCFVLSGYSDFERAFSKKPDKKRKLFNGGIECNLYQYYRLKE